MPFHPKSTDFIAVFTVRRGNDISLLVKKQQIINANVEKKKKERKKKTPKNTNHTLKLAYRSRDSTQLLATIRREHRKNG